MEYNAKYIYKDTKIDINADCIYYFYTYRKWSDVKNLPANDKKRVDTSRILNFKNGKDDDYGWFKKCFTNHLAEFSNDNWIVCSIPGHDQILPIANHMDRFLEYCKLPNNMFVVPCLLLRNKEMPQKHGESYGARTIQKDLDSFKLRKDFDLNGKNIIIFDDITTSGCSLMAAKQYFRRFGAKKVVCIALGKTLDSYGGDNSWLF